MFVDRRATNHPVFDPLGESTMSGCLKVFRALLEIDHAAQADVSLNQWSRNLHDVTTEHVDNQSFCDVQTFPTLAIHQRRREGGNDEDADRASQ